MGGSGGVVGCGDGVEWFGSGEWKFFLFFHSFFILFFLRRRRRPPPSFNPFPQTHSLLLLLLLLLLTPLPHPQKQAYFFALVEHLITSSVRLGLSESQATRLATQTCFGAGKMLVESTSAGKESPAQLRKNVTSPNGTTQAALESFEASGLAEIVDRAVKAAADRGEELGRTLGGQ